MGMPMPGGGGMPGGAGPDLARLKALGGGKLSEPESTPSSPSLPGLGGGGLPGLGGFTLPGFKK
jgi:signal recognition particle subunit SRP54